MHNPVADDPGRTPRRSNDEARRMVEARMGAKRPTPPAALPEGAELDGHLDQQRVLNELGRLASDAPSISSYSDELVRRVAETLGVGFAMVLELDPARDDFTLRSAVGFDKRLVGEATIPANDQSQAGYTRISSRPVVVEDMAREERDFSPAPLLRRYGISSGMSVAVRAGGEVWGVLAVHGQRARSWTKWDQGFLADAAWWLSKVVERSRLDAQARSFEQGLGFVNDANAALAAVNGPEAKLEVAAQLAVGALAEVCFVDVVQTDGASPHGTIRRFEACYPEEKDQELGEVVRKLASRYPMDPTAPHGTPKVLLTGQRDFISDVRPEMLAAVATDKEHLALLKRLDPKGYINVPMRVGLKTIGTIVLISCRRNGSVARTYTTADLVMAEALAGSTALAIAEGLDGITDEQKTEELDQITKNLAGKAPRVVADPSSRKRPRLTERRLQILQVMDRGICSDAEIAQELSVSVSTVRNALHEIRATLKVKTKLEALCRARELDLLDPEG